jgi:hypothetical protein
VRSKNISSVDLYCLTDRTSEVYSSVKPLKDEEAIVGLTVERANPDLTLSSMICPIPLKQDSNKHVGNMNFTWGSFPLKI